jgi:hypothetical protein
MAEEKQDNKDNKDIKNNKGGIPNIYWRYVATFLLVAAVVYGWSGIFNTNAPARTAINYSQFNEQLNAGNLKSVSIKKELLSGELIKVASVLPPGRKKCLKGRMWNGSYRGRRNKDRQLFRLKVVRLKVVKRDV